jgi:TLD
LNETNDEINMIDDSIELIDVLEWMETVAPMFPYILATLFNYILFPTWTNGKQVVLGRTTFTIPTILNSLEKDKNKNDSNNATAPNTTNDTLLTPITTTASSSSSDNLLSVRHFIMSCLGTSLNGYYYPIYNSNTDGLSFNRLQNAILGYGGPTLFVIQSVSGGIFGAYTGTSWKESKDFYGNTDSFLYQLVPQTIIYRPKQRGSDGNNYMYCNSAARSRGYDQQAHGIGFGGTVSQPRLFISENFDDGCMASSQDMTYENGPLLPPVGTSGHPQYHRTTSTASNNSSNSNSNLPIQRHRSLFDIECLEVYGVSDTIDVIEMAIGSRTLNRNTKEELIRKARKVDKAQFLDDFQSGIISSKQFVHRQQIDGRADVDGEDCLLKKKEKE